MQFCLLCFVIPAWWYC